MLKQGISDEKSALRVKNDFIRCYLPTYNANLSYTTDRFV